MEQVCRTWGDRDIALRLPALDVHLRGLSLLQAQLIQRAYAGFVASRSGAGALRCTAQLAQPGGWPDPAALARDGTYAPLLSQAAPGLLHITGIDFEATCDLAGERPVARLFTAAEAALPRPLVLENFLRIVSARTALDRGGLLLHSAGIVIAGAAWLFIGASNAGKTTLSRKAHAAGHRILSDDMNLVLPADCGWRAHAVPFTGEFGRTAGAPHGGESFPLAGLVCLARHPTLVAEAARPAAAAATVIAGSPFINTCPGLADQLDQAVLALIQAVPTLRLGSERPTPFGAIRSALDHALSGAARPADPVSPALEACDA